MDTSTTYLEALNLEMGEMLLFYENVVKISNERNEALKRELNENERKGGKP